MTLSVPLSTSATPGYARQPDAWQLSDVTPSRTDRALIVGQTGSGKTTLARQLLSTRKYSVVLDYKGKLNWPEYSVNTKLSSLANDTNARLLYRPTFEESTDAEISAKLWEWIYRRGNCTVYVDETAAITKGNQYPFYYGAVLMRGRELGLEMWSGTQRPLEIPSVVLSESEHVYAFRLRLPQDRKRVEDLAGIDAASIKRLPKQSFLYAPQDGEIVGPLRLQFV